MQIDNTALPRAFSVLWEGCSDSVSCMGALFSYKAPLTVSSGSQKACQQASQRLVVPRGSLAQVASGSSSSFPAPPGPRGVNELQCSQLSTPCIRGKHPARCTWEGGVRYLAFGTNWENRPVTPGSLSAFTKSYNENSVH